MRALVLGALVCIAASASAQAPSTNWLVGVRAQRIDVIGNKLGVDVEHRVASFDASELRLEVGVSPLLATCTSAHQEYSAVGEVSAVAVHHTAARMIASPSLRLGTGVYVTALGEQCVYPMSLGLPGNRAPDDLVLPASGIFTQAGLGWQFPLAGDRLGLDLTARYYFGWRGANVAAPVVRVTWAW